MIVLHRLQPKNLQPIHVSIFLNLPSELRSLIIENVLYTPLSPPVTPLESDAVEYNDIQYRAWLGGGSRAYYNKQQSNATSSNSLSLILTNHQLSTETSVILKRRKVDYILDISIKKVDYILDISIKNELNIFLTWLSIPCLTTHISTLYANVRLFGHIIEKRAARSQLGDGGRLGFHWSFYAALERFLRYGPVGAQRREGEEDNKPSGYSYHRNIQEFEDRRMLIDTLILDFSSAEQELSFPPEEVEYKHWSARHWGRDRYPMDGSVVPDNLSSYTPRSEWLCEYLRAWISDLISMSYHTSSYGMPLYERIGTIRMLVDGRLHSEFDLATRLACLRFAGPADTMDHLPRDEREAGFEKWKKETLFRREVQGFPVKWTSDDERRKRD